MYSKHIEWCIEQHRNTNHYYDEYLPYEFHLRMVNQVFQDYKHLLDNTKPLNDQTLHITLREACGNALWGHDLIEDCRVSYNQVVANMGKETADIVFAVTNMRGRDRAERAPAEYYKGIRETPGAIFVKLCDRIANVQYSKLTKSRMFETYKKENQNFMAELGWKESWDGKHEYDLMFRYLTELFLYKIN